MATELGMTVDQLRSTMSGHEWTSWYIYYSRKAQREELARLANNTAR